MFLEISSRSARSVFAVFRLGAARSAQRVRTRSGTFAMTIVMRSPDDCRANSIGISGPSQNQMLRTGKDLGSQTSDPQPRQAICMVFSRGSRAKAEPQRASGAMARRTILTQVQ